MLDDRKHKSILLDGCTLTTCFSPLCNTLLSIKAFSIYYGTTGTKARRLMASIFGNDGNWCSVADYIAMFRFRSNKWSFINTRRVQFYYRGRGHAFMVIHTCIHELAAVDDKLDFKLNTSLPKTVIAIHYVAFIHIKV